MDFRGKQFLKWSDKAHKALKKLNRLLLKIHLCKEWDWEDLNTRPLCNIFNRSPKPCFSYIENEWCPLYTADFCCRTRDSLSHQAEEAYQKYCLAGLCGMKKPKRNRIEASLSPEWEPIREFHRLVDEMVREYERQ